MKKLVSFIAVLAVASTLFVSCQKDDESPDNVVTIQGELTLGDKTYTNPTFNLGSPTNHVGYLTNYYPAKDYNGIYIESNDNIDLGNNVKMEYGLQIYTSQPGASTMYAWFEFYLDTPAKQSYYYIYSYEANVTITKVGDVGDYIEGTFEGDFWYGDKKGGDAPFYLKGKFKVKRVNTPEVLYTIK